MNTRTTKTRTKARVESLSLGPMKRYYNVYLDWSQTDFGDVKLTIIISFKTDRKKKKKNERVFRTIPSSRTGTGRRRDGFASARLPASADREIAKRTVRGAGGRAIFSPDNRLVTMHVRRMITATTFARDNTYPTL